MLLSLAEVVVNGTVESPYDQAILGGVAMASLAWRRLFPVVVALVVMGSNILINPEGEFATLLSLVLVSFTIGADGPGRRDQ